MTCIHCGAPLGAAYHLNAWLTSNGHAAYECWAVGRPACDEGITWYSENTMLTVGGRVLDSRREAAVREQREAICNVRRTP